MRVKLFTVEQAERTLPLIRRITSDIVRAFQQREKRIAARRRLPVHPTPGSDNEERAFKLEREIEHCEDEVRRFHAELEQIGAELKGIDVGLVDFYSRYEGRIVYLCWKLDEGDTIAWWHDLQAGFRGRKPVTPSNRARFKGLEPGEKFVELGG